MAPAELAPTSDLDLHVITPAPRAIESIDWRATLPECNFLFSAVRPATGGVRKITAIFASGQLDVVVVPRASARLARLLWRSGLYRMHRGATIALNEMATCLHTGYRFIKGETEWGGFYAEVQAGLPGVRLDDTTMRRLADSFVIDYAWIITKAQRGELIASQHVLHRLLSDTNLRLYRELRLRSGRSLPSFGLGRRIEELGEPHIVAGLRIDARPEPDSLLVATRKSAETCRYLMRELVGDAWRWPDGID